MYYSNEKKIFYPYIFMKKLFSKYSFLFKYLNCMFLQFSPKTHGGGLYYTVDRSQTVFSKIQVLYVTCSDLSSLETFRMEKCYEWTLLSKASTMMYYCIMSYCPHAIDSIIVLENLGIWIIFLQNFLSWLNWEPIIYLVNTYSKKFRIYTFR